MGGGALDLKLTVFAATTQIFKIEPLQCRKNLTKLWTLMVFSLIDPVKFQKPENIAFTSTNEACNAFYASREEDCIV